MKYVLGIDLGTSGTKTVLFSQDGHAVCSATVEYPMSQPRNGWAEQNPLDWWNAAVSTVKAVLGKSGVNHRLRRLEQMAQALEEETQRQTQA